MSARLNVLRLRRGRSVGFALIGVMGFLIAGFVLQPIASSIDEIAPFVDDLQVPIPEVTQTNEEFLQDNPDAELARTINEDDVLQPEEIIEGVQTQPVPEPNFEEPITSDDPIPTQVGDENINNPISLYPTSETIGILVEITKIDSQGTTTTEEFRQEFIPLEFLGEIETGRDFSTGSIQIRMWIESEPDIGFAGNGFFDFKVNDVPVISGLTTLTTAGISDQNGLLNIEFTSPTGQRSNVFIFSFEDNSDLFPLNSKQVITTDVKDFVIKKDLRVEFTIVESQVFSMEIVNSADAITIVNEQGGIEVAFPQDNSLKISRNTVSGLLPKPAMGMITITDSIGNVIASAPQTSAQTRLNGGGYGSSEFLIDVSLARNSIYTIKITDPTPFEFTIETPLSQKNYDFSCRLQWEEAIHSNGSLKPRSASELTQWFSYQVTLVENVPIICNLPIDQETVFPPPSGTLI